MNFTVLDHYSAFFKNNFIKKDINQIAILKQIQSTWNDFNKKSIFFSKSKILGVYVYGSVGTGKTFLLNLFSQFSKQGKKIHFNHLMNDIHKKLKDLSSIKNPIDTIAKNYYSNYEIIFIDEFQVEDVADAMIIGNLLNQLTNFHIYLFFYL